MALHRPSSILMQGHLAHSAIKTQPGSSEIETETGVVPIRWSSAKSAAPGRCVLIARWSQVALHQDELEDGATASSRLAMLTRIRLGAYPGA